MRYKAENSFPEQWAFAKSLSGQYLFTSEFLAEAAGFDSPGKMIGRRDSDAIWKDQADIFRQGDTQAFKGKVLTDLPEVIRFAQAPNKLRQLLVTKTALRDGQDQIIGVIGSVIDITNHVVLQPPGRFDATGKQFILNGPLAGMAFSRKQMTILQCLIMGYSAADIARSLNRSKRTIEGHIEHLKNKLQCRSKGEIIRWAVTSGLTHSIDWSKSVV